MNMPAAEFKAKCLQLMDNVQKYQEEIVITKFGRPVAKLVPYKEKKAKTPFGFLKGTVKITGDIVSPLGEKWEADE